MSPDLFTMFSHDPATLLECLNGSSFDELVEIDLLNNRCRNLCHVDGKYFVPIVDGTYMDLYRYCADHMIHPDDRQVFVDLMEPDTLVRRLENSPVPGLLRAQFRYKTLDGGWVWTEQLVIGGAQFGLAQGMARFYVFDIQNQKSREMGLPSTTTTREDRDEHTGLLRERSFFAVGQEMIRKGLEGWCFLLIDIEHFRLFNDWYGREAGDWLLARMGAKLKQMEEQEEVLAGYLGQDDFCLLMPFSRERVDALYDEIHALITAQGALQGFLPAFGISLIQGTPAVLDLLDEAALAASQLKGNYHTRIRIFRSAMREKSETEYRLLLDFQRALKNGELFFVLQPQCRISTRKVVGAECLTRWRTPEGKMISPADFIPVLEKYGFITDLDQYIWEQVCAWIRDWMDRGHEPIPISINVSQVDIFNINVPDYLQKLVEKYAIPQGILKVEITESAYVDNTSKVRDTVVQLRSAGFPVLMDDFGSGYSSLNMLHELNVDVIKLDAQFLHLDQAHTVKGIHILESIINMTKTMSVPVIVEGVETAEQTNFLADLGCRYIQGYHFYRPMPAVDFEALISNEDNVDHRGILFKPNQEFHIREFLDRNIYSDAMLNNILGAAAFYSKQEDNVDIVRFNEQFYQLVNVPDFQERLCHIQDYIHPADLELFFHLFDQAETDRLNGSIGMIGVYRSDGSLGRFLFRLYYLGAEADGRKFYGSLQEVTKITNLQNQMRLLSKFSSDSIVFLRKHNGKISFQVAVHGLRELMGLDQEEFQAELDDFRFMGRVVEEDRALLRNITMDNSAEGKNFSFPFRMVNARGEVIELFMKTDYVHDEYSDVEYIIIFRRQVEE